ncbi:amidophosphoribosyltransferase [Candidatus Sumerlaeota bacterium]|nr:amidophosphoribosyltransferase [Candidatus Sumerlaeota bacterium]
MIKESCGIMGVFNHPEAAKLVYLGLYALQHRGQESAGIVSTDGEHLYTHKGLGLVSDVFDESSLEKLKGHSAIGHVRYSTTGSTSLENAQPIVSKYKGGTLAIAHNGNITNSSLLRQELEGRGSIFQTTTDSEIVIHLIAQQSSNDFLESLITSLIRLKGAYSLLVLRPNRMLALRDPSGFRPLCVGSKDKGTYLVASESCAFDIVDAQLLREIKPGEILEFTPDGVHSHHPFADAIPTFCVFEFIYYARPDSLVGAKSVHSIRIRLGKQLAIEHPVEADLVISVPDSSNAAALGFAQQSGIPFEFGLIRSHYVGRTFIEPKQQIRDFGARLKYNTVKSIIAGRRVVVVDDSIVRGTTSRKIVKMIRDAGAKEVHFRVSSPPWQYPCFFGIDTPTREELIASSHSIEEIRKHIGADSLGYLSLEGLKKVVPRTIGCCFACFDGNYPGGRPQDFHKKILEMPFSIKKT